MPSGTLLRVRERKITVATSAYVRVTSAPIHYIAPHPVACFFSCSLLKQSASLIAPCCLLCRALAKCAGYSNRKAPKTASEQSRMHSNSSRSSGLLLERLIRRSLLYQGVLHARSCSWSTPGTLFRVHCAYKHVHSRACHTYLL